MAKGNGSLDKHTGFCVGCGKKPVTMSAGHLHLPNGATIYAGWCGCRGNCHNTPKQPIKNCDSPEGCYGFYSETKHGPLEWEWGD